MSASRVRDVVNAGVDALTGDGTLATLLGSAKIYTHVPQKTSPPYVVVQGGDELPWAESFGPDSGGRQVEVHALCVSIYQGSKEVDDIASRVLECWIGEDGEDPTAWDSLTGYEAVAFVRNAGQFPVDLNGDGVLWYQRVLTVRVTVQ